MSTPTAFHQGRLKIDARLTQMPLAVTPGTPLVDVALQIGETGARFILVRDEDGTLAGVVSYADLLRYMARVTGDPTDAWKSRPIETLLGVRFTPAEPIAEAEDVSCLTIEDEISCTPILEHGRLVGVMTDDDLFVSWGRLEPLIDAATTDEVTDLKNRATFNRRIREEWKRSQRNGEPLAILLFDLDHFKEVNDQCGHLVGDAVLSMIGSCLRRHLRSYDVVARFGGDEFAAICCDCTPEEVDAPIRRLQKAIRELKIPGKCDRRPPTLSIGAAVVASGIDELSIDDLIQKADECLYRAKADGRDCAYRVILHGTQSEAVQKVDESVCVATV
jgi:diguanylate cyclase (GGDEF)-like protein